MSRSALGSSLGSAGRPATGDRGGPGFQQRPRHAGRQLHPYAGEGLATQVGHHQHVGARLAHGVHHDGGDAHVAHHHLRAVEANYQAGSSQ